METCAEVVPAKFPAVTVALNLPIFRGMPEMNPVPLIVRPSGRPLAVQVVIGFAMGSPLATICLKPTDKNPSKDKSCKIGGPGMNANVMVVESLPPGPDAVTVAVF
jgi:hypothetical protein